MAKGNTGNKNVSVVGGGKIAAPENSKIAFDKRTDLLDNYVNAERKQMMRDGMDNVQDSINKIMNDPWGAPDSIEMVYERLADYYPRAMAGDDAEKVVSTRDGYITTVDVRFNNYANSNKLHVTLEPHSYSYDEFTDKELYDEFGIERRR